MPARKRKSIHLIHDEHMDGDGSILNPIGPAKTAGYAVHTRLHFGRMHLFVIPAHSLEDKIPHLPFLVCRQFRHMEDSNEINS